jgi:hypothetical protein
MLMRARGNKIILILEKLQGKRPLGRQRCRWVDCIKMDRREIVWDGMGWIDLA